MTAIQNGTPLIQNTRFLNTVRRSTHFTRRKKQKIINEFTDNFSPFNIYLWLHFIGFTSKAQLSCKNLGILFISIIMSVLNDGFTIAVIISTISRLNEMELNRKSMIILVTKISELYLRFLLMIKRRKLLSVVEKVSDIYLTDVKRNKINIKRKIIILLLINDFYFITQTVLDFSDPNFQAHPYTGSSFSVYFTIWSYSSALFYICHHMQYFNMLSPFVVIYFCYICHALKHALINFKVKQITRNVDMHSLFVHYNRITKIISLVNDVMHNMLATTLFILIFWMFHASYIVVFTQIESMRKRITKSMLFIIRFIQFYSVCMSGSSVIKAVNDVNNSILDISFHSSQIQGVPFLLKVNQKFEGFMLFEGIAINKILMLTALGSLLTYGILIATLNT